ncbi:MAG: SGNH/GDSL hydrolase family protein [Clostridia bacterium]
MMYSEIHVWGDSLARGVIYNEAKGRYAISRERCTNRLQAGLDCKVENHASMGATVLKGLESFEKFTPVPGALCAIEFGGNDCDLNWAHVAACPDEPITPAVPLEQYARTLRALVDAVRARGMQPLLATPLPLHAPRYFAWVTRGLDADHVLHALGDVYHIYRWQERYANAMRAVAAAAYCKLLDLRDVFLAQPNYEQLMCVDGIHPNDEGHRVIADAVLQAAAADRSMPRLRVPLIGAV